MDDHEKESPSTRKQVSGNRTIYASRALIPKEGPLKLSDFGESRIGPGPYEYKALPMVYRAPEIMIEVPWSYPIDIWCVGMTVCLFASYSLLWVFCFEQDC
jgi:serine/threonine protein kinase